MIERPLYLQKLISYRDKPVIKVITGIRRCGKSSILTSFAEYLTTQGVENNRIIKMNFEDLIYDGIDYQTLNQTILDKLPADNQKTYIILDEIQRIEHWEKVVNSLSLDTRLDLYLTGSNAYMLSSELSTYLSGRYVEIKMLPLSFKEFLTFYTFPSDTTIAKKFRYYMQFGGMPSLKDFNLDETNSKEILDSIYNTVIVKDVLNRNEIKDIVTLNRITKFLADNISNITSINKITQILASEKSISSANNKLVEKYIKSLENAFIFYSIDRYDIKGKDYLRSLEKYYIVDTGLRYYQLGKLADTGRIIENIVFFELLRRNYNTSIGKIDDKEIDFIAAKGDEKIYIQVCDNLQNNNTLDRELASLRAIKDNFTKIVLTTDEIHIGTTDDGIKIVNLFDWLLQ